MARETRHLLPPSSAHGSEDEPKMLTKQEFGRRLHALLVHKGWNQSELARRAGIGRDAVSTYVRGRSFPEPHTLKALARALDTEPGALLPNAVADGIVREPNPALEIRQASGHVGHCWVRLNRLVTTDQAMRLMQILAETEDRGAG